jgi:very-short-patch-repair endonuclease
MASKGEAQILLEIHLKELGLAFTPEYKFDKKRKWRFDYLITSWHLFAIEIEGGIFTQGRHTRGAGYLKDLEKYREATALGYRVYRFSTDEVLNGTAREFIKKHCT